MLKFYYNDEDFSSDENAVKLPDSEVQRLIDEVTKRCEESLKKGICDYHFQSTGDTMVIGFIFDEDEDDEPDTISINVCRDNREAIGWYKYGKSVWTKMNWLETEEEERIILDDKYLNNCTNEELDDLIKTINKYKKEEPPRVLFEHDRVLYNPHREV